MFPVGFSEGRKRNLNFKPGGDRIGRCGIGGATGAVHAGDVRIVQTKGYTGEGRGAHPARKGEAPEIIAGAIQEIILIDIESVAAGVIRVVQIERVSRIETRTKNGTIHAPKRAR